MALYFRLRHSREVELSLQSNPIRNVREQFVNARYPNLLQHPLPDLGSIGNVGVTHLHRLLLGLKEFRIRIRIHQVLELRLGIAWL